MNTFALIALGILAGILFAVSVLATCVLAFLSWKTNKQYNEVVTQMKDTALITRQLVQRVDSTRFEANAKVMSNAAAQLKFVAEYFHRLYTNAQSIGQPNADTGRFPDETAQAQEIEGAFAPEDGEPFAQ